MIYAATAAWLTLIAMLACAVHRLWGGATRAQVVNGLVLPGSFVVQIVYVIILLATGRSVENASAAPSEEKTDEEEPVKKPRLPFVISMVSTTLPMLALLACAGLLSARLGEPVLSQVPTDLLPKELPASLASFWEQMRRFVSLAESVLNAVIVANPGSIKTFLFCYLMISLTIRMGPLPGKAAGHFVGIAGLGGAAALAGTLTDKLPIGIDRAWPFLTLVLGWLLLMLLLSMLARAAIAAIQTIVRA